MMDSLEWFMGKFPDFLDRNEESNFRKSSLVLSENFREVYNDLFKSHLGNRLEKKVLVWKSQDEPYNYSINFVANISNLKTVTCYKNGESIYTESYDYSDGINTFFYSYDDTSLNEIPDDKYHITVTTYDEYELAKGFPENDTIMDDIYDHDTSLDDFGALYDIPRKTYYYTEETNLSNTEPPYNNRLTEDDYHYMNRILYYLANMERVPLPVLEIWKMFGVPLDNISFINRERYLCKMFEESRHTDSGGLYNEEWVPRDWEHKDRLYCPSGKEIFFFVSVDNASPVLGQSIEFKFLFVDEFGDEQDIDFTINAYCDGDLVKEGITTNRWDYDMGELDGEHKFKFTTSTGLESDELLISVKGCDSADWHVSPSGDDTNDGSTEHPFKTVAKAVSMVEGSRNVIALTEGTFNVTGSLNINTPMSIISCQGSIIENTVNRDFFTVKNESSLYIDNIDLKYNYYRLTCDDTTFMNSNIWNNPLYVRIPWTKHVCRCIDGEIIDNPLYPITSWAGDTTLINIEGEWDTITDADSLLEDCTGLTSVYLLLPEATSADSMLKGCTSLTNAYLDLSKCSDCTDLFTDCSSLTTIDIVGLKCDLKLPELCTDTSLLDIMQHSDTSVSKTIDCNYIAVDPEIVASASTYNCTLVHYANFTLSLDASSSEFMVGDSVIFTATLLSDGEPVEGKVLSFDIDGTTSTDTTDSDGEASVSYTGVGAGDVTVTVSYRNLTDSVTVSDDTYYDAAVTGSKNTYWANVGGLTVTVDSTGTNITTTGDGLLSPSTVDSSTSLTDILTFSDDNLVEFDIVGTPVGTNFTIDDTNDTYLSLTSSGHYKFYVTSNGVLVDKDGSASVLSSSSFSSYGLQFDIGGTGNTCTFKNFKVKPLEVNGSLSLTSSSSEVTIGDGVIFTATLLDNDSEPVSGETVSFNIGGTVSTATTNASGVATKSYTTSAVGALSVSVLTDNGLFDMDSVTVDKYSPTLGFTASSGSIYIGESATLSGTLTGYSVSGKSIKIYNGSTLVDTVTTDSNGGFSASVTPSSLGSYSYKAVFDGDTTQNSAESSSVSVTVSKYPASVTLSSTSSSIYVGNSVTLSGVLTSFDVDSETIKIYNGSTLVDTLTTDSNGEFSTTLTPSAGSYTYKAVYEGTSAQSSAESSTVGVTVNKYNTSLELLASSDNVELGDSVTVFGYLFGHDTGNKSIKIYNGSTLVDTVTTSSGGYFSTTVTPSNIGTYNYKAVFDGDSAQKSSTSGIREVTVKYGTSLSLSSSSSTITYGSSVTLSGTLTAHDSDSETIKIYDGDILIYTITTSGNGNYSLTFTPSVGAHNYKAVYDETSTQFGAESSTVSVTVNKYSSSLSLSASSTRVNYGSNLTLSGTLTSYTSSSQSIKIYNGSTLINTVTTDSNGDYSLTFAPSIGAYNYKAVYDGNSSQTNAESSTIAVTVKYATSVSLNASSSTITVGSSVTLTGQFGPTNISGASVKIYNGSTLVDTITNFDMLGRFSTTVTPASTGTYNYKAVYEGTSSYWNCESSVVTVTVNPPAQTLSLVASADEFMTGDSVTFTATLKQNGVAVSGETISFDVGGVTSTDTTDSNGEATATYTGTGAGDITVTASYGSLLQEIYVSDYYLLHTTEETYNSSNSSDTSIQVFNNFTFTTDDFQVEFDGKYNNGTSFGVMPSTYIPALKQHITVGYSSAGKLSAYVGKETTGEDGYALVNSPSSTYYHIKITKEDSTIKIYLNDTLKETLTRTYLNSKTWTFIRGEWLTGKTYYLKNLKIKQL